MPWIVQDGISMLGAEMLPSALRDVVVCSPAKTSRDLAQISFEVRHPDTLEIIGHS